VGRSQGRDEEEIPFFDAGQPASDSHTYDESSTPARQPGRGRGVGVAVAVMALLATGIVVGGILEPPALTESPSPTGPNASAPAAAPACVPVGTSAVPAVALRAVGTQVGFGGVVGYTHRPGAETPSEGWQVPVADPRRGVPEIASGMALEAFGPPGTCFRSVFSEFADATLGHVPRRAERRPLLSGHLEPPRANPGLGTLPDGDWAVHVTAYFETGVRGPAVIGEFYFRVRVGTGPLPTPTPEPTPAVTPEVACGPVPATPDDVELVITLPGSEGVAGVPDGTAAPTLSIPVGEFAELSVGGDACARSWDIGALRAGTGERIYAEAVGNRNDDPGFVSQNRWRIRPEVGSYDLVASLHFGPGLDVVRAWRIIGGGFTVPDTFLVAANGSRVRALPGCGLSFTLASGYSAAEPCNSTGFFQEPAGVARDELPLLRAPAWSRVALEIPGWTITSWYGACGQIEADPSGIEFFNVPHGTECALGSYSVSDTEAPPAPAQFLVRPGEFVMELRMHATGSAGAYDIKMYARVAGR
jgi:hypothetical protein